MTDPTTLLADYEAARFDPDTADWTAPATHEEDPC